MAADDFLKARLRPRDWDIREELRNRKFATGELSDIIREGVRRVLFAEEKPKALDPVFAELKEKDPGIPEDVEALVDDLMSF
ncbi:MAG: hypothetical protein ACYCVD_04365 [Desulfitobacteriaceae bacterium]